jgi:hypothetical protein
MIRKFNANNFMVGRIGMQLPNFIGNGISFEKGAKRNTFIVTVNENKIDTINLKYLYAKLLPENREIKG